MTSGPDPSATSNLAALVDAARDDAQRFFGDSPPPPRRPATRRPPRRRLIALSALLAVATGAGAAMAWRGQKPSPAAEATPGPPPATAVAYATAEAIAPVPRATVQGPANASLPPDPSREARVERGADGRLLIELDAHDRADAVRRLAILTGAQLLERPEALGATRAVTLHWQGHDVAKAWRALLADEARYMLQCHVAGACKVWVFGTYAAVPSTPGSAPAAAVASVPRAPAPPPMPAPDLSMAAAAGAADMPPLLPDPPGLFPSD